MSGNTPTPAEALLEAADKLWTFRCDFRGKSAERAAAERACEMCNAALPLALAQERAVEALEAVQDWDEYDSNPAGYGGLPHRVRQIVDAALAALTPQTDAPKE